MIKKVKGFVNAFKKRTEIDGISVEGDLMERSSFEEYVEMQVFIQAEGFAYYSDGIYLYGKVKNIHKLSKWYTHIVWYNK